MSTFADLKAIRGEAKRVEAVRAAAADRKSVSYLSFKEKNSATVRFLQELDPAAPNYSADRGTGVLAVEHTGPGDRGFIYRGLCSLVDEGQCWACEQYRAGTKEYAQKRNFYINVLVNGAGENGEPAVQILSRGMGSSFFQQLIERAAPDEDDETADPDDVLSITEKNFRIKKTGEGTSTVWLLMDSNTTPLDDDSVELIDIYESVLRKIPYDEQQAFYEQAIGGIAKKKDDAPSATSEGFDSETW